MAPACTVGEVVVVALVAGVGVVVVAGAVGVGGDGLVLLADSVVEGVAGVAAEAVTELGVEGLAQIADRQAEAVAQKGTKCAAHTDIVPGLEAVFLERIRVARVG